MGAAHPTPDARPEGLPGPPDALDCLGALLSYPEPGHDVAVAACRDALLADPAAGVQAAAGRIEGFAHSVAGQTVEELQELYTRSFDLNPVCALEVGWHLYGENYERGRFLVRMRELLEMLEIDETVELPDHLTSVLPALARLPAADAHDLASRYVAQALRTMLDGLAGKENPYEEVLQAVREVLEARFGPFDLERPGSGSALPHHRRKPS